jgi:Fur family transcriptional regulator, peroxide stress response regulator
MRKLPSNPAVRRPTVVPAVLDGALRARGARPTRQRRAIFSALWQRIDHPTAETLYRAVRRRIPGLSLATVYTTLEVLVEAGLAGRFAGADGVAHYDARTDEHDHRRCLGCGRIDDLDRHGPHDLIPLQPSADFRPTGYRIEVTGYCSGCMDAAGARRPTGPSGPATPHEGETR